MYASSASNPARLGIGTAGQVLQVNSGATAPEWATPTSGGMTSLASGSIAASITGIDITSISSSYNQLTLYMTNYSTTTTSTMQVRINNNSNADYNRMSISRAATSVSSQTGATELAVSQSINTSQVGQTAVINFPNYKNSTGWKLIDSWTTYDDESSQRTFGMVKATAAIDRVTIQLSGGLFDSGTYELFGVK
jgi:hypothetical protein